MAQPPPRGNSRPGVPAYVPAYQGGYEMGGIQPQPGQAPAGDLAWSANPVPVAVPPAPARGSFSSYPAYQPAYVDPNPNYNPGVMNGAVPPRGRTSRSAYGYPPTHFAIPKRTVTVKKVELTEKGNLQIDIPVPPLLLQFGNIKRGWEVENMRYTAATCDPNEFASAGYTLRPSEMGRETELFIVMTMYNEGEEEFVNTMHACITNIKNFLSRTKSMVWGPDAWKKIVVCVISDGRKKINPRTQNLLSVMGCFQEGVMKNEVDGKRVTGHVFEYTSQVDIDHDLTVTGTVPVQMIFLLKEDNAKKINSHRWFFNAFCPILRPHITILLDVGTRPLDTALYHLWKVFDRHPNVGGACGEIRADIGAGWHKCLTNWLVAAQNFEYKLSNILDKPLESSFGYISVLPGAFSAYRYRALTNYAPDTGPLASYFKGEDLHSGKIDGGVFRNNMYLAEDRILCFELVAKPGEAWLLRYERDAAAVTDVPEGIPELVSQRRRWLNGSNFAALYALINWGKIWKSDHSFLRKMMFMLEGGYQILVMLFSWFSIANFFLTFFFLMQASAPSPKSPTLKPPFFGGADIVFQTLTWVYLLLMATQIIISLGNRPQGSVVLYRLILAAWMLIMGVILALVGTTLYQVFNLPTQPGQSFWNVLISNSAFRATLLGLGSTYGLWWLCSFLFLDPWHMFNSFLQYMFLMPFWVNVLQTYAMCNTHDVTWGTKGDNTGAHDLGGAKKAGGAAAAAGAKAQVELELPDASKADEANKTYQALLQSLQGGMAKPEEQRVDANTKRDDDFKLFRTNVVLVWVFTNLVLVAVLTNSRIQQMMIVQPLIFDPFTGEMIPDPNSMGFSGYLDFLFWATTFFSAVKFLGAIWYLLAQQLLDRKEDPEDAHIGNVLAKRPGFNA